MNHEDHALFALRFVIHGARLPAPSIPPQRPADSKSPSEKSVKNGRNRSGTSG
jgi:hypothetical protein